MELCRTMARATAVRVVAPGIGVLLHAADTATSAAAGAVLTNRRDVT